MVKRRKRLKIWAKYFIASCICIVLILIYVFFVRVSAVHEVISELGQDIEVQASDFLRNYSGEDAIMKTDLTQIDITQVGEYPIEIEYKNKIYQSTLVIKDTVAPTATLNENLICYIGNPIQAVDCVEDIVDFSKVDVTFDKDYAFDQEKEYKVTIVLTDEYENKTSYTTTITVKKDVEAPVVESASILYVKQNTDNVNYIDNLVVSDNVSATENIQVDIDDSQVDLSKNGKYQVSLCFKDEVGNETKLNRDVVVYTLSVGNITIGQQDDTLDALLEKLMSQIITDDMSDKQKVEAFYQWSLKNLKYKNNGEKKYKNDINGNLPIYAREILTKRTGHCFHYAALEVYMMNRLNIPVILVEGGGHNVHGEFELHYWTMVQINGTWYHYDPLFEQLYKYTRQFCLVSSSKIYNSSHTWNKSLYPW